jgi:isopenicillin-N N-acyltransferase-like protein
MRGTSIRVTTVTGTPGEMGEAHGRAHAEEIREYAAGRVELSGTGTDLGRDELLNLAATMVDAHRHYDADLFDEMTALAEASGLSIPEAIIVGGYTDFLDVVSAAAGGATFEDDCTAVITPDTRSDGAGFLAQTWDMNASATPHVIMLDAAPFGHPRSLVFTTVGTLGQIGMNEAGIAVGINNLTAADGRPGVTWPFAVRKALAQSTFDDAMAAITEAQLAGGHNFLVFDCLGNGASIEAMPTRTHVERLGDTPVFHTNHCLVPETIAVEGPRPDDLNRSSLLRIEHAAELLGSGPITVESLMDLTRDERSICRHPEPPYDYESCGAAIMRPATGDFWACWGIPSENDYEHFSLTVASVP